MLRLEDEKKYEKILPKIGDTVEVAQNKLAQVRQLISEKYSSQTEALGGAGYNVSGLKKEEQPKSQVSFQQAKQFAEQNPDDPSSQKLMELINSGQVDPETGQRVEQNQQAVEANQPTSLNEINQPENKDNILNRLFEATKEVVPELAGDLGKRLKNIWNNTWG